MAQSEHDDSIFLGVTLDKRVSIGHIITTISMIAAGSAFIANTNSRITALENSRVETINLVREYRQDYRDDLREIKEALKEISDKLDKKADKKGS